MALIKLISADAGNGLIIGSDGKIYIAPQLTLADDQVLTGATTSKIPLTITPITITDPQGQSRTDYQFSASLLIDGTGNVTVTYSALTGYKFNINGAQFVPFDNTIAGFAPAVTDVKAAIEALKVLVDQALAQTDTLVDNGDGTYTHTAKNGAIVVINAFSNITLATPITSSSEIVTADHKKRLLKGNIIGGQSGNEDHIGKDIKVKMDNGTLNNTDVVVQDVAGVKEIIIPKASTNEISTIVFEK
jgi:hypothetical protein